MAAGTVQLFDSAYVTLFNESGSTPAGLRSWDNTTAGNIYFYISTDATLDGTETVRSEITLATGDGATGIAATGLTTTQDTGTPSITWFNSNDVTWGNTVTITGAKYLVAAMPQTPNTPGATDELIFYVELETGSTVSSTEGEFSVAAPTDGWFKIQQT